MIVGHAQNEPIISFSLEKFSFESVSNRVTLLRLYECKGGVSGVSVGGWR